MMSSTAAARALYALSDSEEQSDMDYEAEMAEDSMNMTLRPGDMSSTFDRAGIEKYIGNIVDDIGAMPPGSTGEGLGGSLNESDTSEGDRAKPDVGFTKGTEGGSHDDKRARLGELDRSLEEFGAGSDVKSSDAAKKDVADIPIVEMLGDLPLSTFESDVVLPLAGLPFDDGRRSDKHLDVPMQRVDLSFDVAAPVAEDANLSSNLFQGDTSFVEVVRGLDAIRAGESQDDLPFPAEEVLSRSVLEDIVKENEQSADQDIEVQAALSNEMKPSEGVHIGRVIVNAAIFSFCLMTMIPIAGISYLLRKSIDKVQDAINYHRRS